ncbi:MAG: 3,4-dihydroxy-2-butanone-4-phosphate synthase [Caulobacteraceae bacterium]
MRTRRCTAPPSRSRSRPGRASPPAFRPMIARTTPLRWRSIRPRARTTSSHPGHVFPLVAKDGGVLVRAGHTEAAVDISRMAGLNAAGVICEIMNDDGTMARLPDLVAFAQLHGLKIGTIADLITYRRRTERRWIGCWSARSTAPTAATSACTSIATPSTTPSTWCW